MSDVCPGTGGEHEWAVVEIRLKESGADAVYQCLGCATHDYQGSAQADFYDDPGGEVMRP